MNPLKNNTDYIDTFSMIACLQASYTYIMCASKQVNVNVENKVD